MSSISDLAYYDQNYIDFCCKYFKNKDDIDISNTNKFNVISLYEFLSHKNIFSKINNHPKLIHCDNTDAQMYMLNFEGKCVLSFRGTDSFKDVIMDLSFWRNNFKEINDPNVLVHSGIYSQFLALKNEIDKNVFGDEIILTGHSLGGALATLTALYLNKKKYKVTCCSFGAPRVGCSNFCKIFDQSDIKSYRIVNDLDPVPSLPWPIRFKHVKGVIWLDNDNIYNIKRKASFLKYIKRFFLSIFGFSPRITSDHSCPKYMFEIDESHEKILDLIN